MYNRCRKKLLITYIRNYINSVGTFSKYNFKLISIYFNPFRFVNHEYTVPELKIIYFRLPLDGEMSYLITKRKNFNIRILDKTNHEYK